jgi:hypothetical protein
MLGTSQDLVSYVVLQPDERSRATFRVFKIERKLTGREDVDFLERVFQKLLLNFTWYAEAVLQWLSCLS